MPRSFARRDQVRFDHRDAEPADGFPSAADRVRAFRGVRVDHPARKAARMHERNVDDGAEVPLHGANVIGGVISVRLARFREEIDDEDALAPARGKRFAHAARQRARHHAGVETARTEHDQIRRRDRVERVLRGGQRPLQRDPVDAPTRTGDRRFAVHQASVGEPADEFHAPIDGGQDPAANAEQVGGDFHRSAEVAHPLGERGEDDVADGVTAEITSAGEPMLEQLGERVLVPNERDQAVADVAGTGQVVAAADPAGASAVVTGGHDAAHVEAPRLRFEQRERSQGGRKAGPAAHRDDAQRRGARGWDGPESARNVVGTSARR